jgi:hypothetical protein
VCPVDFVEHDETLVRLAAELERTRLLHETAKVELKRAQELEEDLGVGQPDRSILRAMTLQDEAFCEYSEAVLRYNRFILYGQLSEEERLKSRPCDEYSRLFGLFVEALDELTHAGRELSVSAFAPGLEDFNHAWKTCVMAQRRASSMRRELESHRRAHGC